MKIVINRCYGGFGLSLKAQKRLMNLKGKEIYFYKQTKFDFKNGINQYEKIKDLNVNDMFISVSTKDLGDLIESIPSECYIWVDSYDLKRTDEDLIKVVEELGEEANGNCANLKIIEIPDNIDWEISEYDGLETVEEVHRSWN